MDRSRHLCIIAWFGGVSAGGISLGAYCSAFHTFSCYEFPRGGFSSLDTQQGYGLRYYLEELVMRTEDAAVRAERAAYG